MNRCMQRLRTLTQAAVLAAFAGSTLLVVGTGPARAATLVYQEVNDFDIIGLDGRDDTFLTSQVHQKAGVAWIRSLIETTAPDRAISIHWTDHNNATILRYDGIGIDFKSWISLDTEWVGVFFGVPQARIFDGQADFTGFQLNRLPCVAGRVCDTTHLDWTQNGPPGGGQPPSGPGGPASALSSAVLPPYIQPLGGDFAGVTETRAGLGRLIEDPTAPGDADLATREVLAGFTSAVEAVSGGYRYRYSATNMTSVAADFDFGVHGFSGTLDPGETGTFELLSAAGPGLRRIAPSMGSSNPLNFDARMQSAALSMDVLTPVPEPAQVLLLIAGLAVVALRIGKR